MSSLVQAKCTNSLAWASAASAPMLFLDEVLHRLDVVVGGGLDRLDPAAVLDAEVRRDGLERVDLRRREGGQLGDAGLGGQRQQPLDLHLHAAVHQAELAEDRAQRLDLAGVAAVQRGQGGEGVGGHARAFAGGKRETAHFTSCGGRAWTRASFLAAGAAARLLYRMFPEGCCRTVRPSCCTVLAPPRY